MQKLLIVDDNADLAEGLQVLLEDEDFEVNVAASGEQAISIADAVAFDIALIDVQLPGINGIEVAMEIRSKKPDTATILMSGFRIEQIISKALHEDKVTVLRRDTDSERNISVLKDLGDTDIILVADHDPETVIRVEQLLGNLKFKVLVARNGPQAFEQVPDEKPDVLILNLNLPVINGLEIYLQLQKLGYFLPTIIITGYKPLENEPNDPLHSYSVTGFLFKPFKPEHLLDSIHNCDDSH